MVYNDLHTEIGLLESERTFRFAKERFFLPYMQRDIQHHVTNVCPCMKKCRAHVFPRAPQNISAHRQPSS